MTARSLLTVGAVVLMASTGCAAGTADENPSDGRLVLVSGRDDHGMLAQEQVEVYDAPASTKASGRIPDGTLARVVQADGQWMRIETAEGKPVSGWIDDFFLRGEAHLVGPAPECRPQVSNQVQEAGLVVVVHGVREDEVLVESAGETPVRGWTPREAVQELPPQGDDCGEDPEGGHEH